MIISLKYCSKCLQDLCPDFEKIEGDRVRFFVPTKDYKMRDFFAYIEIEKDLMRQFAKPSSQAYIVNLSEMAKVLHVEQGLFPSQKHAQDIEAFFDYKPYQHIDYHHDMPNFMPSTLPNFMMVG